MKGAKRYVLAPPWACKGLSIIKEKAHPSYRHSLTDWTNIAEAEAEGFAETPGIDTIVHEGEVLYIPSFWYTDIWIVSMLLNERVHIVVRVLVV